jgi:hypothetical protein
VIRVQPKQTGHSSNQILITINCFKYKINKFFFRKKKEVSVAYIPGQMLIRGQDPPSSLFRFFPLTKPPGGVTINDDEGYPADDRITPDSESLSLWLPSAPNLHAVALFRQLGHHFGVHNKNNIETFEKYKILSKVKEDENFNPRIKI